MKKQNGITLISLIITIIIMLILAGVSLSMVMEDGSIIDQANAATQKTSEARLKEEVELWQTNNKLAKYTHIGDESATELIDRLKSDGLITDDNVSGLTITVGDYTVDLEAIDTSIPELPKLATPVLVPASNASGSSPAEWAAIEGAGQYEIVIAQGINNKDEAFERAFSTGSFYWDDTLNGQYAIYGGSLSMITWNNTTISYSDLGLSDPSIRVRAIPADGNSLASEWSDWYYVYLCLSGETEILVYDEEEKKKKKKKLKDIKVGDKVITFNPETKEWEVTEVLACDSDEVKMKLEYDVWTFADGTTITTVNRHRFYNVEYEKMMYMDEWNIGDRIYKVDGTMPVLTKHEHIVEPIRHYTLVNKNENYVANDCLTGTRDMKPVKLEDLKPLDIM